jgi:long-chain acyl-CoA synthetase
MAATTAFAPMDGAGLDADTLGQMVLAAAGRYGGVALRYPQDSPSASVSANASISYADLGSIVREIARGLIALGIERGDRVAILSSTRAEWTLADCGTLCAGAVVVPIYHTNSPEECAYVLHHSGARLVFCENDSQLEKIRAVRDRAPALEHAVVFDGDPADAIRLAELRERAGEIPKDAVEDRVAVVSSEDLATLVYTSGTTGPPKGCLLTHANLMSTTRMYVESLELQPADVIYQFLPLAHVLARVAQMAVLEVGGQLCFSSGDPSRIVAELAEIEPTHFPAVPRVYEKLHSAITGMIEDGPRLRRIVFGWALAQGGSVRRLQRQGVQPGALAMLRYRLADRLALRKVRHLFGRHLKLALVGAAPVGADLLEFFDACGVTVLEGYGLTESCAAATLNTPGQLRFGTVGRPLPGTEIQIAQDGEILIRGPHVYRGYYRDDAATREMLKDGWLHSGDLGAIADDGFVLVTGRKKDLIITSSGKNITPVNIENALRETRWISQAVVYGDERPYLVAIVTLDRDQWPKLAERLQIPADMATMARDENVHAALQESVDEINSKLARVEQIKRFAILDHDLTQAGGELTPTMKVKRPAVYEKHAEVFRDLYRSAAAP